MVIGSESNDGKRGKDQRPVRSRGRTRKQTQDIVAIEAPTAAWPPLKRTSVYATDVTISSEFDALFIEMERSARAIPTEGYGEARRRVKPSEIMTPFAEAFAVHGWLPRTLPQAYEEGAVLRLPPWLVEMNTYSTVMVRMQFRVLY